MVQGLVIFVALVVGLLFFSLSQWIAAIFLVVTAAIFATFYFWKGTVSDDTVAKKSGR